MEISIRGAKGYPHYKYVIRPFYKACAGVIGRVAATGLTFFMSDLVLHQCAPSAVYCVVRISLNELAALVAEPIWDREEVCVLHYSYSITLISMAMGSAVMYAKFRERTE